MLLIIFTTIGLVFGARNLGRFEADFGGGKLLGFWRKLLCKKESQGALLGGSDLGIFLNTMWGLNRRYRVADLGACFTLRM